MSDNNQNEVLITQLNDNESLTNTQLIEKLNALTEEKNNMETDFGFKRAKLKEIMLKKEEEMRIDKEQQTKKIEELEIKLNNLQKELDESKSLLMVSQLQKENEIDYYKQKHNEEIGLIRLNLNDKLENLKLQYELEIDNLKKLIQDNELTTNLKNQQTKNESMLSVVTKSFKQKVGSLNTTLNTSGLLNSTFDDNNKLNHNKHLIKEQQEEDFDFILPFEEETKMLKEKFRTTDKKLNSYEKIFQILINEFGIDRICELINLCSNTDDTTNDTVNKFKEEFMNKKNLDHNIQLDDKDSILANLLCEQARLRFENEKLIKNINQLKRDKCDGNNFLKNNLNKNQLIVPALNLITKLKRSQSLTIFNKLNHLNDNRMNQIDNQTKFNQSINDDKSCEMCSNYELQLQELQLKETDFKSKLDNYDKLLNQSKQELLKEQEFRLQREDKFIQKAKELETTIDNLKTKLSTANYEISQLKCSFDNNRKILNDKLQEINRLNKQLNNDVVNLQNENAKLLGLFVKKSKELQREIINLPQNLEELQFYCLKIREDLISISINKEKIEEDFKSQLMLIDEQQKSQKCMEESLISKNAKLKSQLSSAIKELNNLKTVHNEHELLLKESSSSMQDYDKKINELQNLNTELMNTKIQLEKDNCDLKSKVLNLQSEIETSVAVQKDFVKLSQSLQIELEKIRQADIEVRWQHEDDVTNCNNCKKPLNKKEKLHCNHCGKIFCDSCNNKTILGGPYKRRKFKVCNVCHTLLDQTTAPYFSSSSDQFSQNLT